jgi:teichuronic acid biosynthesis protein TuaE
MKVPDATLAGTPHKDLWLQLLALRWPLALASAVILPLVLPLPGNPITLAAFVAFIGGVVLVSSLRWLIVFLPVLAAVGPYFLETNVAAINLFGFRLLIITLAVFSTPLTSRSQWWSSPVARYTVLFMVYWIVWGMLSLLWTPDLTAGLTDVLTLVFGLGLVLALLNLKGHAQQNLDMLRFGWIFALVVVLAQATWEMLTGDRLPGSKTDPWDTYLDSSTLQSTLGTPGGFAAFLLLSTPFVLWSMGQARGPEKLIYVGLLAATGFFVLYGAARSSFFALSLELVVYFLILERRWYVRGAAIACGVVAALLLASVLTQSDFKLAKKYESAAEQGVDEGSISQRMDLTVNGIWMAIETGGRGIGAGGFRETVASGDLFMQLRNVEKRGIAKPAHNVWVQILAEYGALAFLGLMILFGWIARLCWQARRAPVGGQGVERGVVARVVLVGLVGLAFYGVQGGEALRSPLYWMFFASLSVLGAFLCEERARRGARSRSGAPLAVAEHRLLDPRRGTLAAGGNAPRGSGSDTASPERPRTRGWRQVRSRHSEAQVPSGGGGLRRDPRAF